MAEALDRARQEGRSYEESIQAFFGAGDVMTEPIFYSGFGVYDFQYWTLAPRRYRLDRDWLRTNTGLELETAAAITRAIKNLRDPFLEGPPENFDTFLDTVFAMFCGSRARSRQR